MFPNNVTTDVWSKPDALQLASHVILESNTDGILPIQRTIILKVALYKAGKPIPMRFFVMDIKKWSYCAQCFQHTTGAPQSVMP